MNLRRDRVWEVGNLRVKRNVKHIDSPVQQGTYEEEGKIFVQLVTQFDQLMTSI
jgi:hypothetical protein